MKGNYKDKEWLKIRARIIRRRLCKYRGSNDRHRQLQKAAHIMQQRASEKLAKRRQWLFVDGVDGVECPVCGSIGIPQWVKCPKCGEEVGPMHIVGFRGELLPVHHVTVGAPRGNVRETGLKIECTICDEIHNLKAYEKQY